MDRTELMENLRKALADGVSLTPLHRHFDRLEAAARQGATVEETSLIHRASESTGHPMCCCAYMVA